MFTKLRYIILCFGIVSNVAVFAQSKWRSFLPKPSTDISVWTSINNNFSRMVYNAGSVNPIVFESNNRLSQTVGVDYASYTLQYSFNLPLNSLDKSIPLSDYWRFEIGYGGKNWEIDAYFSQVQGWVDVHDVHLYKTGQNHEVPRYRDDMLMYTAGLTVFYFLNEKYSYSHAMKHAYKQNESGFTFYSSFKHKYHWLWVDSTFYLNQTELVQNSMNDLNHLFVLENSITFGLTRLWTNGNWFLRGLIGVGPGVQFQRFNIGDHTQRRTFISPAVDAKLSFGYKTRGLYMSFNVPFDAIFVYLPDKTHYYQTNPSLSFLVGFQLHDLFKRKNHNEKELESTLNSF
ncbi:MAG: hypothetical protein LBH22_09910 [Bacteroidales bacterium]|jgi:hypothetical protein|nr:hypothetical protein [Bacteroidales bacterium]